MIKPDWKDAPKWANYLAMDDNGIWFWYEIEPEYYEGTNEWLEYSQKGKIQIAKISCANETLEKRP